MNSLALKLPHYESTNGLTYEDWQHARRHYLGGSEIAAIMGKNPYKTALQVWKEKTGQFTPQVDSGILELGRVFEAVLSAKFSDVTGLKVHQDYKIRFHKQHPFLRANLDRVIVSSEKHPSPGVLELKTTNSFSVREWTEEIPLTWLYQIQFYLMITGYSYAYLYVYERDTCKYHFPKYIERDEALIQELEYEAVQFWTQHVEANMPPEPVNNEDVLLLYPDARQGKTTQTSLVGYADYSELKRLKSEQKELAEHISALELKLKLEIGDAEQLYWKDELLCSWKNVTQRRFDGKAFQEQDPEYFDSFLKPTTYRRFTLN